MSSSSPKTDSPDIEPAKVSPARFDGPRFAQRFCGLIVASLAAWAIVRALTLGYPLERALWLARISGWTAAGALLLSLSMTPLGRLAGYLPSAAILVPKAWRHPQTLRRPKTLSIPHTLWPALRRALGVTAALAAIVHAAWTAFAFLDRSWSAIVAHPYLRAGLLTLCILLPLLLTSFPAITRRLRVRLWKPLHRLSYLAGASLLQHLLLSPFAPRRWVIVIFAVTLAIGLLRMLPARHRGPA